MCEIKRFIHVGLQTSSCQKQTSIVIPGCGKVVIDFHGALPFQPVGQSSRKEGVLGDNKEQFLLFLHQNMNCDP